MLGYVGREVGLYFFFNFIPTSQYSTWPVREVRRDKNKIKKKKRNKKLVRLRWLPCGSQ